MLLSHFVSILVVILVVVHDIVAIVRMTASSSSLLSLSSSFATALTPVSAPLASPQDGHRTASHKQCSHTEQTLQWNSLHTMLIVKVHKAFASVLGTDELIVDIDRLGIMRPTKLKNGQDLESWKTMKRWVHLDCNPIFVSPFNA